jgi:hypothetical protein
MFTFLIRKLENVFQFKGFTLIQFKMVLYYYTNALAIYAYRSQHQSKAIYTIFS